MAYLRIFWPLVLAASVAACSGNLGGGQSTLPGTPNGAANVQQVAPPTPTASPVSASNVATIGDSVAPQSLPAVMGWGGTIAFARLSASPTPSPSAKTTPAAAAQPASPVSIGLTAAVVEPADAPHLSSPEGKGHHAGGKHADLSGIKGLLYISLLATADVTLPEYPQIAVDMPRDIAAKYRDDRFALALFDPDTKVKAYRLAVAERDLSSSAPAAAPVVTPTPVPSVPVGPGGIAGGGAPLTPPPVGSGLDGGTLPPEHVAFLATSTSLTLKANRPVTFAFYVIPAEPSPSPSSATNGAAATPSPLPSATATSTNGTSAAGSSPPGASSTPASVAAPSPAPRPT